MSTRWIHAATLLFVLGCTPLSLQSGLPPSETPAPVESFEPSSAPSSTPSESPTGDTAPKVAPLHQQVVFNFDLDDNVMDLPTKIYLYHRKTGEEVTVGTGDYAEVKRQLGKSGKWKDYEYREGSFRDFRDNPAATEQQLVKDIKAAYSAQQMGPSWDDFVAATSRPETARMATIITARGQSRDTLHAGLCFLRSVGVIEHVLEKEHLFAVNDETLEITDIEGKVHRVYSVGDTSERKAFVQMVLLDRVQQLPIEEGAVPVVPPSGQGEPVALHLWGFSDDDYDNFEKARDTLQRTLNERVERWNKIKITLLYTGTRREGIEPHAVVLVPGGEPRPQTASEADEHLRVLQGDENPSVRVESSAEAAE